MSFLFSSSKKEKVVAIFDVGSGSVGGALTRIPTDKTKVPTILKSFRTEVAYHEELDFDIFLKDMLKALSSTAEKLYQSKICAPDEILCVLASPWYLSETRTIKMTKDKPFVFTSKLADDMLDRELASIRNLYKEKYSNTKSEPEIIEQQVMGVSLNGYLVDQPLGMHSRSAEMNMAISMSPKSALDAIREILSQTFHHIPITFSSFVLSSYIAVRDRYVVPDSYLLLDIGGEITDVAIITKGVLKASISFPFGRQTFFKYMCTKLDIELRDAEELFKLYSANTLSESKREKVEPLFKSIENSWGEEFRRAISSLPHTLTLPSTIFLTANLDIRDWFVDVIRNEPFIQSMVADHKATVVVLEGPEFLTMCSVKDGTCDPFLMIEAIAYMRKLN